MATLFLLEPNLKWKNPLLPTFPSRISPVFKVRYPQNLLKIPTSKLSVNCSLSTKELAKQTPNPNPFKTFARTFSNALKKPAITALLVGLLLMWNPNSSSLAASGGRIGGSSFKPSSSSHSSCSRSYSSSPSYSSRSYSSSPSSSNRSYSTRRLNNEGEAFSYSVAYSAPTSFGSIVFYALMGLAAFYVFSALLSDGGGVLTATEKTSVLKLQVGLLGMARSLQRDLNRIAETADTSSSAGLSYILTETALALLRHPDYCISGYSSVDVKESMENGEKRFNQLSIEERGKFDEETLVNVNNIRKRSSSSQRTNGFSNEYIVITILVAAEGVHKLPAINSSGDLKEAVQKLAAIPSSRILAVEVLWTPQNENDTLSEREFVEDYSLLRPL